MIATKHQTITGEQRRFWDDNGYLVLRQALSQAEMNAVEAEVDRQWAERKDNDHEVDVLSGPFGHATFKMSSVPEGSRQQVYKLNNLFARASIIREVAFSPLLKGVLSDLLEGEPLICNSLNFERGSQQGFHIDSWYMPPPVEGRMVVASLAFDDVDLNNGPLIFYPGSHLMPAYRFSDGRLNEICEEAHACRAYLDAEIAERGLTTKTFSGKRGDIFLWHCQFLHGGAPIQDFRRTRKSMVIHYWRKEDVPAEGVRTDEHGAYLARTLRGEIEF